MPAKLDRQFKIQIAWHKNTEEQVTFKVLAPPGLRIQISIKMFLLIPAMFFDSATTLKFDRFPYTLSSVAINGQ